MSIKPINFFKTAGYAMVLLFSSVLLLSCKKKMEVETPIVLKPETAYLRLDANSANQLTVSQAEKNSYTVATTGEDPYILTEGISKALHQDSVVLTFEYKSTKTIDKIQLFFGPPISENRSVFGGSVPVAAAWSKYSIVLNKEMKSFSWGKAGDFMRLDLGTNSGVRIELRNIHFRKMNASELAAYEAEQAQIRKDESIRDALSAYLKKEYSSAVTGVKVDRNEITITGEYSADGNYSLCEIYPNDTLVTTTHFKNKIPIDGNPFRVTVPRMMTKNNLGYDRLHSRWVIVKEEGNNESIASHARYADVIQPVQSMPAGILQSKKGLGGFFMNEYVGDIDHLGIKSITVNIPVTAMMYSYPAGNTVAHTYGDKKYYFSLDYLARLDDALKLASSKGIVVAAIILVQKASESADPVIGNLLQHPDFTAEGIYTMPNLTTDEGVHCYAAALDFLASRYNRANNTYGRIHKWIMHNEVDAGLTWTNMGRKPMLNYLDTYIRSMRMCHNISRQYDPNSEVMGSFTHSWTEPVELYSSKEMLTALQKFSTLEGDFQWGIAYHPYPQDLNEPKTWNDSKATFSSNSPLVTFKNLEVIDHWVKLSENKYQGSVKRSLWLSENGTNSRTYDDKDLKEQAAGFAYAWKKLAKLDGIDAIQWHNWIDNRTEFGLRIGLRRFPDDSTDPAGRKPVWYAYEAAETSKEDEVFEPYKSVIGISNWNEIMHTIFP